MNAALMHVLKAAGISGVNAVPVIGQIFGIAMPIIAAYIQKRQAAQIAQGLPPTIPSVEELTGVLNATLDQGDAEWAAWVATHPKQP